MRLLLSMILMVISLSIKGQEFLFENYSSEQGLSQNSCYTIAQDDLGFMWFGTQDGLNRYDGKEFKVYHPQNTEGNKLPSNYISALHFDQTNKQLWIGTIRGTCLYDTAGDSLLLITEKYPYASVLLGVAPKKISSFNEDEFWIVSFNNGLLHINTKTKKITSYFNDASNRARVTSITMLNGKIIVSLLNKLFWFEPQTSGYKPIPVMESHKFPEIRELYATDSTLWIGTITAGCFSVNDPLSKDAVPLAFSMEPVGVGSFITDANKKLWIGTRGSGILHYDPVTRKTTRSSHNKYDKRTPGKNFVLSMYADRQGIIWCGLSGSGIAKYDPLKYQFQIISNEPTNEFSLPDNMIFEIYKSREGEYYVGSQGSGMLKWDIIANRFISFPGFQKPGAAINTVYDIDEDDEGNLWIASWGGLIKFNRKLNQLQFDTEQDLLQARKLYSIIKLQNKDSLFITGENGPIFYDLKEKQWKPCPTNPMQENTYIGRNVYEDEKNILWICTVGGGLIRYDPKQSQFRVLESVRKHTFYVRHLFPNGSLQWLSTDNGIIIYDPGKDSVLQIINPNPSANSNVCYAVLEDNNGQFWTSTNTGLYKINSKNNNIQHYNLGNGLTFLEYNTACCYRDTDGSLLFGGVGGITRFNPTQIKPNNFSPPPLLTSIRVNEKPLRTERSLYFTENLSFKYNQNFITIYFAVNNFSNHTNNRFTYRLKGLTDNWSEPDNENIATYTSLPPGEYTFELRSSNSDGKWSKEMTSLGIIIHPPWWNTWWFWLAALIIMGTLISYFVVKRIKKIRNEATLKQKITETEMMALRSQMNPHFVFNSLNSIQEMILNNENQEASRYLSKFAQLIRITLDQSSHSFVSLRNTIDYLERYIEMEKIRNRHFSSHITVDQDLDLDDTLLPPMLIQPFIENAIWHGLTQHSKEITVNVHFKKEGAHFVSTIEDDGIGFIRSMEEKKNMQRLHQSVGIENVKERIRLLNEKYNIQSNILIADKSMIPSAKSSGTIVTIRLPLQIPEL